MRHPCKWKVKKPAVTRAGLGETGRLALEHPTQVVCATQEPCRLQCSCTEKRRKKGKMPRTSSLECCLYIASPGRQEKKELWDSTETSLSEKRNGTRKGEGRGYGWLHVHLADRIRTRAGPSSHSESRGERKSAHQPGSLACAVHNCFPSYLLTSEAPEQAVLGPRIKGRSDTFPVGEGCTFISAVVRPAGHIVTVKMKR